MKAKTASYEKKAEYLMKNKMLNNSYKSKEDAIKALALADIVGIPWMRTGYTIDVISGNPSISTKAIAGLLTQAGIAIKVIKDWEPVYEEKPVPMMEKGLDGKKSVKLDPDGNIIYYKDGDGILKKKTEIDRVTEIEFYRHYPNIGVVSCSVTMCKSDAELAKWITKNTWSTLPKFLATARCLSRGARLIGADITGHVYSTDEVVEFTEGVEGILDEEGNLSYQEINNPKSSESS